MKSLKQYLKKHGNREFVLGEGRISGYLSALLGLSCLLGVICFHFPAWFTTPNLRKVYSVDFIRDLLLALLVLSFLLGILSYILSRRKRLALTGVLSSLTAIILGGANIEVGAFQSPSLSFGLDWFVLALLFSMLVFIPLEKALAKNPDQIILRPEWRTDMAYFFVSHLLVQFILFTTTHLSTTLFGWAISLSLQEWVRSWPVFIQFVAAVFFADLGQYGVHRLYHTVPFLWRFHAIHHSSTTMDWLAGSRTHFLDVLTTRTAVLVPLLIMGFSEEALKGYLILVGFQAVFVHANVGLKLGFLRYILVTPQYHHWHHSDNPDYAYKNYAVHLPIIDLLFGSFMLPRKEWPSSYGVLGKPLPKGMIRQFFYPFSASKDDD